MVVKIDDAQLEIRVLTDKATKDLDAIRGNLGDLRRRQMDTADEGEATGTTQRRARGLLGRTGAVFGAITGRSLVRQAASSAGVSAFASRIPGAIMGGAAALVALEILDQATSARPLINALRSQFPESAAVLDQQITPTIPFVGDSITLPGGLSLSNPASVSDVLLLINDARRKIEVAITGPVISAFQSIQFALDSIAEGKGVEGAITGARQLGDAIVNMTSQEGGEVRGVGVASEASRIYGAISAYNEARQRMKRYAADTERQTVFENMIRGAGAAARKSR